MATAPSGLPGQSSHHHMPPPPPRQNQSHQRLQRTVSGALQRPPAHFPAPPNGDANKRKVSGDMGDPSAAKKAHTDGNKRKSKSDHHEGPDAKKAHVDKAASSTPSAKGSLKSQQEAVKNVLLARNFPPKAVCTGVLAPFLTPREMGNFYGVAKAFSQCRLASAVITKYGLTPLIDKYLYVDSAKMGEGGKTKALRTFLNLVEQLCESEKIAMPSYDKLVGVFREIEARNLLRMFCKLKFTALFQVVGDLQISKNPLETIQKAEQVRAWVQQNVRILGQFRSDLDLSCCCLTVLPVEIGHFKQMTRCFLNKNQLLVLPKEIGMLKALKSLSLNDNLLVFLPDELFGLAQLEHLYLENNVLRTIKNAIGRLKGLQTLHLSRNNIVILPPEIGDLSNLTILYLHDNKLTALPVEIGKLKALKELQARNNQLRGLPKEMAQMDTLLHLNLWGNDLRALPRELGSAKTLTFVDVNENGLIDLPEKLEGFFRNEDPSWNGKYPGILKMQDKRKQLDNILNRLIQVIKGKNDQHSIGHLLNKMELYCGAPTRAHLEKCLFDLCNRHWKDATLRGKLQQPSFARDAFIDPLLKPKIKLAAIHLFRNLKKEPA